ncbi:MAG: helix-turn-helix domain-containing protein [Actinomycetota bacterium]|nr:helix-turn-helix domain-containing protein [Actinomycetota bacterium]
MLVLDLDRQSAGHLAVALRLYERRLRADGHRVLPGALGQLLDAALAGAGQARPEADEGSPSGEDGQVMLLDYDEVAGRLGVSERTVRRLVAAGQLSVVRVGNAPRVHPEDLQSYVDGLRQQRSSA